MSFCRTRSASRDVQSNAAATGPRRKTERKKKNLNGSAIILSRPTLTCIQLCGAGVFACFVGETHNGKGMHAASIRPDEFVRYFHWTYFHSIIVTVGISLVKLSVGFFLLRLATGKPHRIFLWCVIGKSPSLDMEIKASAEPTRLTMYSVLSSLHFQ